MKTVAIMEHYPVFGAETTIPAYGEVHDPTYDKSNHSEKKHFYQNQVKLILLLIGLWTVVQFITFLKNIWIYGLYNEPMNYGDQFFKRFISWITAVIFILLISYSTMYLKRKKIKYLQIPFIHFGIAVIVSLAMYFISYYGVLVFDIFNDPGNRIIKYYMVESDRLFLMYLLISITTTAHYYFHEIRRKERDIASLKDAYQKSKLISLNTELNPHMIFNSLNNICTVISDKNAIAKEKIVELSQLLRENLRNKDKVFTTLEHECKYIKKYIKMYNKGRSHACKIHLNIPTELKNAILPKMVLQPIVENAIKHTKSSNTNPLRVSINFIEENSNLKIHISNNGEINFSTPKNENLGIGLNNIINRLKIIYKNQFSFDITEQYDLFTCFIKIPLKLN